MFTEEHIGAATIDAGGISVKYLASGAGEPVVLVHSTAGSGRQWAAMAEALRSNFRVIAPDLCGYGGTAHWPGNGTFNLAVEADLIAALLDMLGKPAHIVGHSYGGAVALQFAFRYPDYLRSLTLIEPASFHLLRDGDDMDDRAFRQISEVGLTVANAVNCGDYLGGMHRFVDYWNGEGAWDALPAAQRTGLAARINKVTLDFWATINDPLRLRDLAGLATPTLVVRGGRSPLPTRRICFHLSQAIPDAQLRTIPDAGHMLPFSHFSRLLPLVEAHCGASERPGWRETDQRVRIPA
ncbi:MAG TPA: alpha/beta hydrolase [Pseudolabrys sp.]|jgi:pimeloyl-ACP methyl ester carboxylesterase